MNNLNQYVIPLKGLKEGEHTYHFEINDTFFDEFENSEIKKGNLKVSVLLTKQPSVITLIFKLKGFVVVICDRCLDEFDLHIDTSNNLYVKFSENENDEDEVIYISETKHQLNIAQYIYEFIDFSVPLKRIHSNDEHGNSKCNNEMINKLNVLNKDKSEITDPRWEKLKNLKN